MANIKLHQNKGPSPMIRLSVLIYLLSLACFAFFTFAFVDIHLFYLRNLYTGLYLTHRLELSAVFTLLVAVLFGCFYIFITNSDKLKHLTNKLVLLVVAAAIIAYPAALTFDIFNYMTTAKVVYQYHENPYVIYPLEFVGEPNLLFTRATNKLALYGPFWILLTAIPYFLGFGNFILTLFSFKAFIALFYLATVYLIRKMDRNAVIFFALNPLVVVETLVSSHNDIVMVFFALLAVYFIKLDKVSSIVAFVGSVLIKFSTAFLIPVYLLSFFSKLKSERIYAYSAISMLVIFALSPIREELYPWYAIWFIAFTAFLNKNKFLQTLVLVFSFGLMLRYIPYIATGNYFGPTPIIRNALMILPVLIFLISIWLKRYFPSRL